MASSRDRSILPLPEAVVAQIKSSTIIVSLAGVVLELLENSLDAKATRIEATVDFVRGGCAVEDNGLGIAPSEFRQEGSLCKIYCTSKYYSQHTCLGRNGTFLASLAAMCLLHIVSRHHENRSHHLLSLHHSKTIDRQLPAQPQHEIHNKHGTRVTVRNLFGNLPVRVKQRPALVEHKTAHDRLWETLRREVTALVLSWGQPVALRIRDADGNTLLNFSGTSRVYGTDKTRSSGLHSTLNALTQANYIAIDEWTSWIPASASTSTLSIKGAISLDPAPTKRIQFISLGIRPLSAQTGNNELFDEVNRVFSLSCFGAVEDNANIDDNEKFRRQSDRRFKSDGYTNRQLTARKGVDRYPMFHLRILLKSDSGFNPVEDRFIEDETNLQAVVEVLNAMITQWLSTHHFRPRKPRAKRNRQSTYSVSPSHNDSPSDSGSSRKENISRETEAQSIGPRVKEVKESRARKPMKPKPASTERLCKPAQPQPFAQWSRIKSGKANFFDTFNTGGKLKNNGIPIRPFSDAAQSDVPSAHVETPNSRPTIHVPLMTAGSLDGIEDHESSKSGERGLLGGEDDYEDGVMTWTDPSTKQTLFLNARTGCVLPSRPFSAPCDDSHTSTLIQSYKPSQLTQNPSSSGDASTPWLSSLLETWDNPVFRPTEKGIQQMYSHVHQLDSHDHKPGKRYSFSRAQMGKAFSSASANSITQLSKAGLQQAEVMAQLDRKFILVKMRNFPDHTPNLTAGTEVLVLIDQHAADERIQVESLLSALCKPLPPNHIHSGYRSKLGHESRVAFVTLEKPIQFTVSSQEQQLLITHAKGFAAWGILYNVDTSSATCTRQQSVLSVTTLPPAVSERCKADPQVLITFLRSAVWNFADTPRSAPLASETPASASDSWVGQLSTCPEGLIGLINSRACRSAIMFNDELGLDTCKALVKRLSACVFPFMCAHGRPSMVPLVDLGGAGSRGDGFASSEKRKDFLSAWKARKM